MTAAAALKESERRWGRHGHIQAMGSGILHVGRVMMGIFYEVKGSGKTWEAAFADADRATKASENDQGGTR